MGVMKGVIAGIAPRATLIDITHRIKPQGILQASFIVGTSYRYFPRGTIHLIVVDPGVGTSRKALILATPQAYFVAPDNGVLTYVVADYLPLPQGEGVVFLEGHPSSGIRLVSIENPEFWLSPVSATFHGRDIFAPVAAHLARGIDINHFGRKENSLFCYSLPQPVSSGEVVKGEVVYIDHFGNLITNLTPSHLPPVEPQSLLVEIGGYRIKGLSSNYTGGKGLIALMGSSNYLEIALPDGNAASYTGVKIGESVQIKATKACH